MEKKTILLVEDDGTLNDMLMEVLQREYNVLAAASYSGALKYLNDPIDIAVIDYSLPDKNGFEVLKAFRETKKDLPAILITAYGTEELAIKAIKSRITDYLKKPFSLGYLKGIISKMLNGEKCNEYSDTVRSCDEFTMEGIAAFIENNYSEVLTREILAKRACMSKYKFSRAFNECFRQGVKSYINGIRLKKATELLKNQNLKITDVSQSVGYDSLPHFERLFRHSYSISPREYRKRDK